MREMVYLSNAKLQQFLPERPRWWRRFNPLGKAEISTPFGKVGLDFGQPIDRLDEAQLAAVIAEVEASALWFDDDDVEPGQWIQFELPLNYAEVTLRDIEEMRYRGHDRSAILKPEPRDDKDQGGDNGPLLFLDCPQVHGERAPRLLLHGSPAHLLGQRRDAVVADHGYSGQKFLHRWLRRASRDPLALPDDEVEEPYPRRLVDSLDRVMRPETAGWMAGFARTTAIWQSAALVSATPLYVERVPPPRRYRKADPTG